MALLQQFRQILQMKEDSSSSGAWDTEALWNRIQEQTQQEEAEAEFTALPQRSATSSSGESVQQARNRRQPQRWGRRRFPTWKQAVWTGALAAIIALAGILWMRGFLESGQELATAREVEIFSTETGERATVRLNDGTRVHLNVNSRLSVPKTFEGEKRTVELEGEAFFNVATDSTRPFIVHAGRTVTRVLGTAFNVSAYPEDGEAKVVVAEGRVSLRAGSRQAAQEETAPPKEETSVVLTKRQMARVLRSGDQVIRRKLDLGQHLAWMNGELAFSDAPFEDVVRSLERWYGLNISLQEGMTPPSGHLNARFAEDQDLRDVLKVVATAFRVEYERRRKQVTFTRLNASPSP